MNTVPQYRDPLFDAGLFYVAGAAYMATASKIDLEPSSFILTILIVFAFYLGAKVLVAVGNSFLNPNTKLKNSWTHWVFWMLGTFFWFLQPAAGGFAGAVIVGLVFFIFPFSLWRWAHK